MEHSQRPARRPHSEALRAQVLSECAQAGASIAGVALAHGLNANLVHKWRRKARGTPHASAQTQFIALALPPASRSEPAQPDIRVQIQRANATIVVNWPLHGGASCAAWLREWLK